MNAFRFSATFIKLSRNNICGSSAEKKNWKYLKILILLIIGPEEF